MGFGNKDQTVTSIPQSVFDVHYRPATRLDGRPAARLIYTAAPVAFDYVFGAAAVQFLEFSFDRGRSEFGWQCHQVAVLGGQVVGMCGVVSGKGHIRTTIHNTLDILAFYGWRKALPVIWRGLRMMGLVPAPGYNRILIAHVAVDKAYRGRGIASSMLARAMGTVSAARSKFILDVAVDNQQAQKLYERLGFVVLKERSSNLVTFNGAEVPGHRRMQLKTPAFARATRRPS